MIKMTDTKLVILVFDENGKVFLVLKNPRNNPNRDVFWQLPEVSVTGDLSMNEQAKRLLLDEYNIELSDSEVVCVCESMEEAYHIISIGLASYNSDISDIEIKNIKDNIAYGFYDMDALGVNVNESSRSIIKKYTHHNK